MKTSTKIAAISGILVVLISFPISFYITYSLLQAAGVDRLVWFLFWVNIPVLLIASVLSSIASAIAKEE